MAHPVYFPTLYASIILVQSTYQNRVYHNFASPCSIAAIAHAKLNFVNRDFPLNFRQI